MSTSICNCNYNLTAIPGFQNILKNGTVDAEYEKYYSLHTYSTKSNEEYSILKYNKEFLFSETINTYGLLRSVILSGSKVVCFSPPKTSAPDMFMKQYPFKTSNIVAEQFVEGTMINVFYDTNYGVNGCWQIATRNTVGAEVSFFKWSNKTFHSMFLDACSEIKLNVSTLNPNFCYSFVLQHPENRIVTPFKRPNLYLIAVYQILNESNEVRVVEHDISIVQQNGLWDQTGIKFTEKYEFTSYTELIEQFASPNTPYDVMGIVIRNTDTGERTKVRNPNYEEVRQLRGNQPKLQYQYLSLRKAGKLPEFLKYFPETKEEMSKFRDQVHMFTRTLHQNYIACYVKREKPLAEFPDQYKTHMYKLHEIYLNELRAQQLFVSNTVVMKYVNNLHPSLLMYSLNYNLRKRIVDTVKANIELV